MPRPRIKMFSPKNGWSIIFVLFYFPSNNCRAFLISGKFNKKMLSLKLDFTFTYLLICIAVYMLFMSTYTMKQYMKLKKNFENRFYSSSLCAPGCKLTSSSLVSTTLICWGISLILVHCNMYMYVYMYVSSLLSCIHTYSYIWIY